MVLFFSENFVHIMIIGALIGTAIAAISLIGMFINDVRKKQVW